MGTIFISQLILEKCREQQRGWKTVGFFRRPSYEYVLAVFTSAWLCYNVTNKLLDSAISVSSVLLL